MPKRDIPSKWLKPTNYMVKRFETSQGLVERYLGKVEVGGSNPTRFISSV
ncbi:MAG: hypothetical protein M3264_05315 [Thermoproteota archaeon]|nr:hypothetical protein [Thermoproteota archaeon]